MKNLCNLLKRRKQNDRIKIQWALALGACIFLVNGVRQTIILYQLLSAPIEYELELPTNRQGTVLDVTSLLTIDDVRAVTEDIEATVTFQTHSATVSIPCISLSKEYMEEVYGIEEETGMTVLYVNQTAYQLIADARGRNAESAGVEAIDGWQQDSQDYELQCNYSIGDKAGVAKIVLLASGQYESQDILQGEAACVYQIADSLTLQKERTGLQISFEKRDVDGTHVRKVEEAGYQLQNEQKLQCDIYQQQIQWMKVRQQLVMGIVLVVFIVILQKYGKDSN